MSSQQLRAEKTELQRHLLEESVRCDECLPVTNSNSKPGTLATKCVIAKQERAAGKKKTTQ